MKLFPHSRKSQPAGAPALAPAKTEGERGIPAPAPTVPLQLRAAYAVCRSISRAAARNFYYGFLVLPREKRDALCAVYAFMRHADDISDQPDVPAAERRVRLAAWLDDFRRVIAGAPTDDPVLLALADTQYRYVIPPALLETLVEGTAMDLDDCHPERASVASEEPGRADSRTSAPADALSAQGAHPTLATYATFDDLYRYCYHVASVVGLICIRIFGYRDPGAEPLAERVGVAFQLTNIIRDVKEDAAMGRVYLPLRDLEQFGRSPAEIRNGLQDAPARFRPVLEFEAQRAREFYSSADQLLPLIDEDSRPALWTLVTIYRSLLDKIATRGYDVFSERVSLTTTEKLSILAKGFWRRIP